ncbi:hypothetical protein [Bradyrhizobium sp. CCBAU 53421]|uniref:hypothetical protein n=1 Tax=Bradyrhizobium sp. CCBAU 53421 TaxID=1325120 RepID=UPI00188A9D36|nr:hypothetical protein [Bradyrhizobium sp. CCBAU 53421]
MHYKHRLNLLVETSREGSLTCGNPVDAMALREWLPVAPLATVLSTATERKRDRNQAMNGLLSMADKVAWRVLRTGRILARSNKDAA